MTYRWSEVRKLNQLKQHLDVEDFPGVYAFLTALNGPVIYIGISDKNLRRRIQNRPYKYYAYISCKTTYEAYILECGFYHDFEPTDNRIHPALPRLGNFPNQVSFCPKCGVHPRKN